MSNNNTLEESPKIVEINKKNDILTNDTYFDYLSIKISSILMEIIYQNTLKNDYNLKLKNQKKSIFTSKFPPKISLSDFIRRIIKYSKISKSILICALIYIDRICKYKNYILTYYNTHRLYFTAILLAIKFHEDNFKSNKFYSTICGIKLRDLNLMEYTFSIDISFNLYIKNTLFKYYDESL
jgi:hypothetical protein